MAPVDTALASVEPEAPPKVALPAVRPNPVELEPVKLGTDSAKTSGASPPASETGIKVPAARIATGMARVEAALALVEPEAPLKVSLPVAVRQNPVELEPVKLGVDLAKTSGESLLELETAIVIARLLSQARLPPPCPSPTKNTAQANKKLPQPSASLRGGSAACFGGVGRGSGTTLHSARHRRTPVCGRVSGD
jgi:hypothetical protein